MLNRTPLKGDQHRPPWCGRSMTLSRTCSTCKPALAVARHLIGVDLFVPFLLVTCCVALHLARADADRLHSPESDQPGNVVFACLVVVSDTVRCELALCCNHNASCVCLQRANGHVLDEVPRVRVQR